jgi:hypothetical protein
MRDAGIDAFAQTRGSTTAAGHDRDADAKRASSSALLKAHQRVWRSSILWRSGVELIGSTKPSCLDSSTDLFRIARRC